ncbi:putative GatA-binding transcription factor isoform 2 [Schistosoma japonicum]|uniref:Putative GatA-binding transcription factor n=3 Tax=Schistosoma japonicum TaxID=6182 RepID=C7TXQ7_SCHJA|nr:putative GatA-binding transcription factor isoform 2 [Schistosoma japonicum]TNN16958.1 putative GatA-binding transcription factor isoform 2 [Schistosoma japonicum]TNN16959.1 putative GatA-binding transcription factor isoform 2 [Schistosoma japonicum]CAX82383.1 putative GatA-binding transcription factor [Schistosoma japonicum]
MHNERRNFRPELEAGTIRVVACKQNRDLRITFANDYACSERQRPTGSKATYSTPGLGLRETNGHKMQRQPVISHKGARLNKQYRDDSSLVSRSMDSHTLFSFGSTSRRPAFTESEFDYQNNCHSSAFGIHSINKDRDQYNRDLMTQYEINRALFLANPPPSVLASRNRARGNNKLNDSRRVDVKNSSSKQPVLNSLHTDHSAGFRPILGQHRGTFSSKSMKEPTFHNLESGHDNGDGFSTNSRGFMRHSRVRTQNNFHRGRGSKQFWCHDDRFDNCGNSSGIHVQNFFRNGGDSKTRQYSGDEYIDDLTPEDIAKYKLEINMDKPQRYTHNQQQSYHYYNHNNRYHPHHNNQYQNQKNQSNSNYTSLYYSSRKELTRPNNRIRNAHNNHNAKQYQTDERNKPNNLTNSNAQRNEVNNDIDKQVINDELIQSNEFSEDSTDFEQDITGRIFDIQSHDRARSFLTLGIDDSEFSQNDCYVHASELSMQGIYRCHSLPSLRNLEKTYQLHSFEDCTTPTTNLNTDRISDLSKQTSSITTTSTEPGRIQSEDNVNISSTNVFESNSKQFINMNEENQQ